MPLLEAHIEEFEQGTWVADLISDLPYPGQFQLLDGSTWIGTKVSERADRGRYFSKVVGGLAGLGKVVDDQFYQGQISLQLAVNAVCAQLGEVPGAVTSGVFLSQYQRLIGVGSEALDSLARAAGGAVSPGSDPLLWWIARDGSLQMQIPDLVYGSRPGGADVSGTQNMDTTDVDGSVELLEPQGAELGALYGTPPQAVRHIRWKLTPGRFSARLFFFPFIFRPPTQRKYDLMYNAKIASDHGDGTVDVIAYRSPSDGKSPGFGVQQVPLFCGVPGSKVKTLPGEQVMLGFFGGDPQKPFCVAMKQDTTAAKKVARDGDSIQLQAGTILSGAATGVVVGSSPSFSLTLASPVDGTITSGSARLMIGDA